jgi:hypothetical protein
LTGVVDETGAPADGAADLEQAPSYKDAPASSSKGVWARENIAGRGRGTIPEKGRE